MTTTGDEGPHKVVLVASDKERTYHESVVVNHWKEAKFVHIKPSQVLSPEEVDNLVQGFIDHTAHREDRPIIIFGDTFDIEVYVLKVEENAS